MKTVNPIYAFVLLLFVAMSICSCSEDLGYDIQDAEEVTAEKDGIYAPEKMYKKAAPKKRTSFKAAPKKRTIGSLVSDPKLGDNDLGIKPKDRGLELEP